MSLTSYRAAPPRVGMCLVFLDHKTALDRIVRFGAVLFLFDRLEDLAATYSPVP